MNAIETIMNHRSIRKFLPDPISNDLLSQILEAGFRAATTGNMQLYSAIVTREQAKKEALLPSHFGQKMVSEAPVILTFCADFNRFNKWCLLRDAKPGYDNFLSFMTAAIDALLVAQNVAIAAESKGLGTCYLGTTTYNADKIIEILQLPKGVVPVTTLVLGYPAETPGLTDRLPANGMIHYESYSDYTHERINEIYAEKELDPFYQDIVKQNEVLTLAHVFTDKRYSKKDNEHFSATLLEVLRKQGFLQ